MSSTAKALSTERDSSPGLPRANASRTELARARGFIAFCDQAHRPRAMKERLETSAGGCQLLVLKQPSLIARARLEAIDQHAGPRALAPIQRRRMLPAENRGGIEHGARVLHEGAAGFALNHEAV